MECRNTQTELAAHDSVFISSCDIKHHHKIKLDFPDQMSHVNEPHFVHIMPFFSFIDLQEAPVLINVSDTLSDF